MFCIRRNNRILCRELIGIYDENRLKYINIMYDKMKRFLMSQHVVNIVTTLLQMVSSITFVIMLLGCYDHLTLMSGMAITDCSDESEFGSCNC
jgi:hypothetical protein